MGPAPGSRGLPSSTRSGTIHAACRRRAGIRGQTPPWAGQKCLLLPWDPGGQMAKRPKVQRLGGGQAGKMSRDLREA